MRYLLMVVVLLALVALAVPTLAEKILTVDEYFIWSGNPSDTLGRTRLTPDSIRIVVIDSSLTELFDAWFEPADAQCALNGNIIGFSDQWGDINGAAGVGHFSVTIEIASDGQGNVDVFSDFHASVQCVTIGVEATFNEVLLASDTAQSILAEVVNIDAWNPITDNDSLIVDQSTINSRLVIAAANIATDAIGADEFAASAVDLFWEYDTALVGVDAGMGRTILDSLDAKISSISGGTGLDSATTSRLLHRIVWGTAQGSGSDSSTLAQRDATAADIAAGAITASEMPTIAYFDTLIYLGGVWIDNTSANTNTTVGTDGVPSNPVSTIAAAKTIADALGYKTFFITNSSDLTMAGTTQEYEFIGIGENSSIDLNSVNVNGSYFYNLMVGGTNGSTSDIVLEMCHINDLLLMDGHLKYCGIDGDNSIGNGDDLFMEGCHSMVSGNGTPSMSFGAGICMLGNRHYSGGIEIQNAQNNDPISIEGYGQVVVNANCTNPVITVRGNFTLTDNDGGTVWTRDAVFSRQEVYEDIADSVWAANLEAHDGVAGSFGDSAGGWGATSAGGTDTANIKTMLTNNPTIAGGESDMTKISGDAGAADNWESMLDGTGGGTLDLAQLAIRATSAEDTAFLAIGADDGFGMFVAGAGSGEGVFFKGGGTGHGAQFQGGGTSGNGILSLALVDGHGMHLTGAGTSKHGLYAVGAAITGDGIRAFSGATSGAGFRALSDGTNDTGMVVQGIGTGDGLAILSGAGATGDALSVKAKSTNGDAFVAAGSGTGAGLKVTGGAGGHGGEFTGGATGGAGIRAVGTGGNAGISGLGDASGPGMVLVGGDNNGSGLVATATGTGNGIWASSGNGATGDGIRAEALSTNGNGIKLIATGTGEEITSADLVDATWDEDSTGHSGALSMAFLASQTGASAGQDTSDVKLMLYNNLFARVEEDTVIKMTPGGLIETSSSGGLDTLSTAFQLRLATLMADTTWKSLLADRDDVAGSFADSSKDWKGKSDLGDGLFKDTIFAIDTSGTDVIVAGATISATAVGGSITARDVTNILGYVVFSLDSGAYTIAAAKTGFIWPGFTDTVSASKRDSVYGYDRVVSTPGSASLCTVHGWLKDEKDEAIIGASVTAVRLHMGTVDSSSTAVIVPVIPYVVPTDTTGYFELFLRKTTSDWTDSTKGPYTITGDYNGQLFKIEGLSIPDQDSLNLGDSLAVRGK